MPAEFLSPNRRYLLRTISIPMRMSHEILAPVLVDVFSGKTLLDLSDTLWSVDLAEWADYSERLTLSMRKYPGSQPGVTLVVFPGSGFCQVTTDTAEFVLSFPEAAAWFSK